MNYDSTSAPEKYAGISSFPNRDVFFNLTDDLHDTNIGDRHVYRQNFNNNFFIDIQNSLKKNKTKQHENFPELGKLSHHNSKPNFHSVFKQPNRHLKFPFTSLKHETTKLSFNDYGKPPNYHNSNHHKYIEDDFSPYLSTKRHGRHFCSFIRI